MVVSFASPIAQIVEKAHIACENDFQRRVFSSPDQVHAVRADSQPLLLEGRELPEGKQSRKGHKEQRFQPDSLLNGADPVNKGEQHSGNYDNRRNNHGGRYHGRQNHYFSRQEQDSSFQEQDWGEEMKQLKEQMKRLESQAAASTANKPTPSPNEEMKQLKEQVKRLLEHQAATSLASNPDPTPGQSSTPSPDNTALLSQESNPPFQVYVIAPAGTVTPERVQVMEIEEETEPESVTLTGTKLGRITVKGNRTYFAVGVQGVITCEALLDLGADATLMTKDVFEQLNWNLGSSSRQLKLSPSEREFSSYTDDRIQLAGVISFDFAKIKISHPVNITNAATERLLIRAGRLRRLRPWIDFGGKQFWAGVKEPISYKKLSSVNNAGRLKQSRSLEQDETVLNVVFDRPLNPSISIRAETADLIELQLLQSAMKPVTHCKTLMGQQTKRSDTATMPEKAKETAVPELEIPLSSERDRISINAKVGSVEINEGEN
ncbi:UNVERIFIED_CONTAM: hypothetical protein FKN15_018223 [Acipenser sinensis]